MKVNKSKKVTIKKSKKAKKPLSEMSIDSFMETIEKLENESDSKEENIKPKNVVETEEDSDNDSETELDPIAHKKSLSQLKKSDPEFYEYLKENDKKLLDFDISDSELDSDDETTETNTQFTTEDDDENDEKYKALHILPTADELKGASDESDYEVLKNKFVWLIGIFIFFGLSFVEYLFFGSIFE